MPNRELADKVAYHMFQGESRETMKELLLSEGWAESAIDEVFKGLPKPLSFWQQLPIYPYFAALDAKTAKLPPKIIFGISVLLVILVMVIAYLVYYFVDPFALDVTGRDKQRDEVYIQLQTALGRYYNENNRYPQALSELVPNYINYVPGDPKTNKPYDYGIVNNGANYIICIYYETKSASDGCLNSVIIETK